MKKVLLAALVALVLAPAVLAGGPDQTTTPWDRTRLIAAGPDACPFPIQVHSSGDDPHVDLRQTETQKTTSRNFHIEWTNLDNGLSLPRTPLGGPVIVYPDGTVVILGNDGRFIGKGRRNRSCRPRPHSHHGRGRGLLRRPALRDALPRRLRRARLSSSQAGGRSPWLPAPATSIA